MKLVQVLAACLVIGAGTGPAVAQTVQGNPGGEQMQAEMVNQLKRYGVDWPEGSYMTLEQINRLQALIQTNQGDDAAIRSGAREILGM